MLHQEVGLNMLVKAAKSGRLISIDLKKMEPIGKTIQIHGDFTDPNIQTEIKNTY